MLTVLANGCFDLLHAGHVAHLQEAREMGGILIVALTSDTCVRKGPGRPVMTWEERATVLRALRCVDLVVASTDLASAIRQIRPDVIAKGPDWGARGLPHEDLVAAAEVGARIAFTKAPTLSTTEIIKRIRCGSA